MAKPTVIPSIELPFEDGEFQFFMNYNGEPAYAITIVNEPNEPTSEDLGPRTEQVSATFKVATMPIEGGNGEEATVTLYMQGEGMYAVEVVAVRRFEDLKEAQAFQASLRDKTLLHGEKELNVATVHVVNLGPKL